MATIPKAALDALAAIPSLGGIAIRIGGTEYDVAPLDGGEDHTHAFRLAKRSMDGDTYDVTRRLDGEVACTCPNYVFVHAGNTSVCKHIRSLIGIGLLPQPRYL